MTGNDGNGVRVVHVAEMRARPGVRDEELIAASQEAQDGFFAAHSGYAGRELLKSAEGVWLDIMYWESEADAAAARQAFRGHASTRRFGSLLDPTTFKMIEYRSIRKY